MRFNYVAYNLIEGIARGSIEARGETEARGDLLSRGYKVLNLQRARSLPQIETILPSIYHVKNRELIGFARQSATMLSSGANLLKVIEMQRDETRGKAMRNLLTDLHARISEGEELSAALRHHRDVFDEVYISLIEVGEHTGRLGHAFEQLAEILSQSLEAKQRAIKSMTMPAVLIGASVMMLFVISFVAMPPMINTFKGMGVEIPLVTSVMIGIVNWLASRILIVVCVIVALFVVYKLARRFAYLKYLQDLGKAKLPLVGPAIMALELGRFSRILSILLQAGVGLTTALGLARNSTKNAALNKAWEDAEQSLLTGHRMAEALVRHRIVPSVFIEMTAIGEDSNSLGKTMGELSDAYRTQFEDRVSAILGVAEPVSTLAVGGVVLFMALSVMQPILTAADSLR